MAKRQIVSANSMQLGTEKGFRIAVWTLAVLHTLLSVFRYTIDISRFQAFERWFALVLFVLAIVYLLVSKIRFPLTMYRIKNFFKTMKSYEQFFMVVLFFWFALICWIWQSTGRFNYMKALDWWILDAGISALVLFPLAFYAGKDKAKLYIESLLHVVAIAYTIFIGWCLWHIFHLNILTLPSGTQVGMTRQYQLMIGCHYNITGAISFTILAVSCYMIFTQKTALKIFYGISAFLHLVVCMLSNSRTVFICVLFLGAVVVFSWLWYSLESRNLKIRIFISAVSACAVVLILWGLRYASFNLFDSITNFRTLALSQAQTHTHTNSEENIRELTNLSGRPRIWLGALRIMVSSPKAFFFGVTPAGVTQALRTFGGLKFDCAHAHNAVLQVGASMGVPAMIAFIVFNIKIIIRCVQIYIHSRGLEFKDSFMPPVIIASLIIMNLAEAYLIAYFSVMSCIFFLLCGLITCNKSKA